LIPFPAKIQDEIIPILPLWGLVTFGAYLLFSLGWGVATFKDTEDAYHELVKVCIVYLPPLEGGRLIDADAGNR